MTGPSARDAVAVTVLTVALAATACLPADPTAEPTASIAPVDPARAAAPPDPREAALATAVADLARSVDAARAEMTTLLAAADDAEASTAADRAVAQLTASEDLAGSVDDLAAAPLLPGPETSREETVDYGDALSATLTAARNAGASGSAVLGLLRDAVAGDLGIWQRDAEGMLDLIDGASRTRGDLAAVEAAVIDVPGEGSRALAYALRAARTDGDGRRAYAERALAHLDIIATSIDELDLAPTNQDTDDG